MKLPKFLLGDHSDHPDAVLLFTHNSQDLSSILKQRLLNGLKILTPKMKKT